MSRSLHSLPVAFQLELSLRKSLPGSSVTRLQLSYLLCICTRLQGIGGTDYS